MKKRVISAIIMILIFVPLLLAGGILFAGFMTILSLMAMYELMSIREKEKKFPSLQKFLAYLLIIFSSVLTYNQNVFSYTMSYQLIAFIILVFLLPILMMLYI